MTEYYELSYYRDIVHSGRWEHIYFSISEKGELKIVNDDRRGILNSRLKKIDKEKIDSVLKSRDSRGRTH